MFSHVEPPAGGSRSFAGPDRRDLDDHERALLRRFADRWAGLAILDLGVGSGRTWFAFGYRAGRYVGVEVVSALARRARQRSGGRATVLVADAARLPLADGGFDLVCFPFHGLDYADPPTRTLILREVARVMRSGAAFYFSTHSLEWLLGRSGPDDRHVLGDIERQRLADLDAGADSSSGVVMLRDDAGNGTCYVTHEWQLAQLRSLGFAVVDVHGDASSRAYLVEWPGSGSP